MIPSTYRGFLVLSGEKFWQIWRCPAIRATYARSASSCHPPQTENILLMLTTIPYTYTIDAAASVPAIIEAGAGAGKIMGL
jgi:hypothetical protein